LIRAIVDETFTKPRVPRAAWMLLAQADFSVSLKPLYSCRHA
jgi:hypothetical protein